MIKKLILIVVFLSFQTSKAQDINGVWQDSSGSSFKNCYAIFAVKNDSVFYTHYLEYNDTPFVEYGIGKIKNNVLDYAVTVSLPIPGWSSAGIHHLVLSEDGLTLRGSYSDNLGNKGPIVFKRKFPKKFKTKK